MLTGNGGASRVWKGAFIMVKRFSAAELAAVFALFFLPVLLLPASGLNESRGNTPPPMSRIRLATTTSTDNSGLLEALLPVFTARTGIRVDVIAVGTGKALALGENGDVDAVLVHAPSREKAFVDSGHGVNRRYVMYNDFVILGPPEDPAGISGISNSSEAFTRIADSRELFISRGDDSGTNIKEKAIWASAGVSPAGNWYREAGQGMAAVLVMASEVQGYTLADRGTWLAMKKQLKLRILVEGDPPLFNPYSVIAVNPRKHPKAHYMESMLFIAWLTSPEGIRLIGDFRINDEVLFIPESLPAGL